MSRSLLSFTFFLIFVLHHFVEASEPAAMFRKRKSPPKGKLAQLQTETRRLAALPFEHIDSVTYRLEIYIRANDPSAVFCELKANRDAVAKLEVFDRLVPLLILVLQGNEVSFKNRVPAVLVSAVINAFIHFNVNVLEAAAFENLSTLQIFVNHFKSLQRFPLAFFILLQDSAAISHVTDFQKANFYAVKQAILLLKNQFTSVELLKILYNNFGVNVIEATQIPRRLFRDSPDIRLCFFLLSRGFEPSNYPNIYAKCRFPVHHPKWEYFSEIYGHEIIEEFLQSGRLIRPQKDQKQFRFPFQVVPLKGLDHPRWDLYAQAYGDQIVQNYKLQPNLLEV